MGSKSDSDGVQYFDQRARTYERDLGQIFIDRIHQAVLDLVERQNKKNPPESVLDVGCGTGWLLRKAGQRWPAARLIGVDSSQGMLEVARRLSPGIEFCAGSADALPLPDASVDVALSTISFHHWNDQAAGVRDIARLLRPNGCFFLADVIMPAGLSLLIRHFKRTNPAVWQTLFTQASLSVVAQERRMAGFMLVMIGVKRILVP